MKFLGKVFTLKFQATDQPVQIYEFFLPADDPSDWIELVEIQIYPVNPNGNQPRDFANRTAAAFEQQYPDLPLGMLANNNSAVVILDFIYPTSTHQRQGRQFLEFNAFMFFPDIDTEQVIGFHYAKNIESTRPSRTMDDVNDEILDTRVAVEEAMAKFSLFDP